MKKAYLFLAVLCVFAFARCSEDNMTYDSSSNIKILKSDVNFPAIGGEGEIHFSLVKPLAEGETVKATSSKTWVIINETKDGVVAFSVASSGEPLTRSANITLKAGNDENVVTLLQDGTSFYFNDMASVVLDPRGLDVRSIGYTSLAEGMLPTIGEIPEWLHVTATETHIEFLADANLTRHARSASVIVTMGWKPLEVVATQEPIPVLSVAKLNCDCNAGTSAPVVLSEEFAVNIPSWSVEPNDSWYTLTKSSDSFTLTVEANNTGAMRTSSIAVKDNNGEILDHVPVVQMGYNYETFMGNYGLSYDNGSGTIVQWTWTINKHPEVESSYVVSISPTSYPDMLKLDYISEVGKHAIKLLCPQDMGYYDNRHLMLRPNTWDGYGVFLEDSGYDLVYTVRNGIARFEFQPNEVSLPHNLMGLWFYEVDDDDNIVMAWDWCMPVGDEKCLSLIPPGQGTHEGYTKKK